VGEIASLTIDVEVSDRRLDRTLPGFFPEPVSPTSSCRHRTDFMPDAKVSSLPAAGALSGTELLYADDGANDVKVTAGQIRTFAVGAGSLAVASGKVLSATSSLTLAGTDGKTLTLANSLTLAGTDGSTLNVGAGGTLGTAAFRNTGTSGATVPLLNTSNTFSLAQTIDNSAAGGAPLTLRPPPATSALDIANASTTFQYFLAGSGAAQMGTATNSNLDFYVNNNFIVASAVTGGSMATTQWYVRSTQAATSTNTGGLRVDGGAGIAGNLYVGGILVTAASASGSVGLRISSGTAPSSPSDGDLWYDGTNLKFRVGASTKTFTLT
jgi:hypothetical protein